MRANQTFDALPRYPVATLPVLTSGLLEKLANQTLLFLILDPSEEFGPQSGDGLSFVEGHLVVNLTALKMAWLAFGLENRLDFGLKVGLRTSGSGERRRIPLVACSRDRTHKPGNAVPTRANISSAFRMR